LLTLYLLYVFCVCFCCELYLIDSPFWDYHPFLQTESGEYPPWTPQAPILSWHIHVYFLVTNQNQTNTALSLREAFLKQFQPIPCASDCDTWCPSMCVWPVNFGPRGPHPVASFGVYVPLSLFPQAIAFISSNHAGLSILVHPNTGYPIIDHGSNAFWMQQILPLDLSQLIPYEPNSTSIKV
jgi:aromatic ring-cleaving dioxygenase